MTSPVFRRHQPYVPPGKPGEAVAAFAERCVLRRTVREFDTRPVDRSLIESALRAAGSAPSGANKQPWRFICVGSPTLKHKIRMAAEEEERRFYNERAPKRWLDDLIPFGTNADKSFLEDAPWLIAVFAVTREEDGGQTYYINESVGIAVGILLAALNEAGLATLTHTPSPMRFLREVLDRPETERPYLLIPVGWPKSPCMVPDITRKSLQEIAVFHED